MRPASRPHSQSADIWRRRLSAILRSVTLVGVAVGLVVLYLGLWPLSYDLTQGSDFSYEYLLQYPDVWEWFRPIFERFELLFPGAATSLELLTALLALFWIVSFALYLAAFVLARSLPEGRWLGALIVLATLVFQLVLVLMPGTFTTDLFSYAMYGYIPRVYELNPYVYVPGYFPDNRMTSWIHPVWYYTPSIYGPVWLDFSYWLTGFTSERSLVDQAMIYRLVSNLAQLVNLGLAWQLIRKLVPARPYSVLLLFAWNPLLLFEFAASGHNDSFMMMFVLLAALLAEYERHALAVATLSLGALVKVTPILLLPLLLLYWSGLQRHRRAQLRILLLGSGLSLALAVALYLPWYSGPEIFQLIDYWSKGPMYMNYVPDLPAQPLADLLLRGQLDRDAALETVRTIIKWCARSIFLCYLAWELRQIWLGAAATRADHGRAQAAGRALLPAMTRVFLVFLLLVNTWVLPWYLAWPLMLAVPLGWERFETRLMIGFSFSAPLVMYLHHYWSTNLPPWMFLLYLAPLGLTGLALTGRRRSMTLGAVGEA